MAAGILMVISIMAVMTSQIYLGAAFDWEDKPLESVFRMYQARLPLIQVIWFVFALGSMLLIPVSLLLFSCFRTGRDDLLRIGSCFGVIAGFSYVIGIMRWVFLADVISAKYVAAAENGAAADAGRALTDMFHAFNVYAGNSFGETIAPIAHATMAVCIGIAILLSRGVHDRITRIFGFVQIMTGIGLALRPLEYAGLKALGRFSDTVLIGWSFVFLGYGIYLICKSIRSSHEMVCA